MWGVGCLLCWPLGLRIHFISQILNAASLSFALQSPLGWWQHQLLCRGSHPSGGRCLTLASMPLIARPAILQSGRAKFPPSIMLIVWVLPKHHWALSHDFEVSRCIYKGLNTQSWMQFKSLSHIPNLLRLTRSNSKPRMSVNTLREAESGLSPPDSLSGHIRIWVLTQLGPLLCEFLRS